MDQICNHFSLDEIRLATEDFSEDLVVGRGGFGKVYKGYFRDKSTMVVAIKRSNSTSSQGAPEFWAEVEMLSKLRHCNLVSLIGYCNEGTEMALVYDYMSQGSLDYHLHKSDSPLSWLRRLKICIGAARGLDYLHTGTGTQHGIVHRDVKSSNILLDENFAAKISDFGLAKVTPTNQTHTYVSTGVKGTFGYMDPCYFYSGKLTRKSDVYAFGVVLLEVMCGRPAVDESLDENMWGLAPWAQGRIREGKLNRIIDSRLTEQISSKCLKKYADIACRCLHDIPNERPTMAEIVATLESIRSLQERLDSSETEGNFVNKVYSLFTGKPKASTLLSALKLDGEGEPIIDEIEESIRSNTLFKAEEVVEDGESDHLAAKTFTFRELAAATKNFRGDCLLKKGGFHRVYKGRLGSSNKIVAIKQLDRNGPQGNREFLVEVLMLSLLHHQNLVNLIGYCADGDQRLLVYEYMALGSLDDHLHDPSPGKKTLDWNTRMKIAAGVARGLEYLHDKCSPPVIYRDLKCSNILLGESYHPKLSDFGLAKVGPVGDNTHVSTRVMGTYGYCAPEYAMTGQLTLKVDVYSFGVVLLEIITGRKAIDNSKTGGEQNLIAWVRPLLKDRRKFYQIPDPLLQGQYPTRGLYQALAVAAMCVQEQPNMRPVIADVVIALSYLASQKYEPENHPIQNARWSPATPPRSKRDNDKKHNGASGSGSGSESINASEKNLTKKDF